MGEQRPQNAVWNLLDPFSSDELVFVIDVRSPSSRSGGLRLATAIPAPPVFGVALAIPLMYRRSRT